MDRIIGRAAGLAGLACAGGLALAVSASDASAQYVHLKGRFIAKQACAATRKKDSGNPGNVRLENNRAYELKGRNATPGTHYQIVVPGVRGTDIRWVPMACGVTATAKQGRSRPAAGGTGADPAARPAARQPTAVFPGLKPDSLEHVFAASWQPGFCATRPRRRECRDLTADRFDASHFSIHGLWPDDLDDRAIFPCYCNTGKARACSLKLGSIDRIDLSDSVRAQLRVAMPGSRAGLHLYEWTKHGTCYERDRTGPDHGSTAEEYFSEMLGLLEQLNWSAVQRLFAESAGQVLSARKIAAAFDAAFGSGAGARVIVRCAAVDGRDVITELWISLGAGITADSGLGELLARAPPASVSSSARQCREGLVVEAAQG